MDKQIYTDTKNKDQAQLLYSNITYKIRGAIFNVYNELGFGHKEQVYQKALAEELNNIGLVFKREANVNVNYKGKIVGNYRPDFTIEGKIIIELKAVPLMPKNYETQLIHYLKTTDYKLGLLVNFGSRKLFIKRLIWNK